MTGLHEYIFKIAVLGNGGVGKTSLVLQYTEHKFQDSYIMTIGTNFAVKMMKYSDDIAVKLQIWDLAGQKAFNFVRPTFYQGSHTLIFVFDLTQRESFDDIVNWVEEANQFIPNTPYILVGNKADIVEQRVISKKEGELLAAKINAPYYEVSAKTAQNLEEMFQDINDRLVRKNVFRESN